MAIEFNEAGPLKNASLVQINECIFWDKTRPPKILALDDDASYTVKIGDRLDLMAFVKLGDSARGWIILLRNDLRLIPNDLVPGATIFIPSIDSLRRRGLI